MKAFIVLALVFVAVVFGHENKHHMSSKNITSNACHFKNSLGVDYDFRLLEQNNVGNFQYYSPETSTTFYFSPCGNITSYSGCPVGASICMVSNSGKAVNFGSNKNILWAEGAEIEGTYGNGEVCNNGAHRRSFVNFNCSSYEGMQVTLIDECTAQITINSMYACPVDSVCININDKDTCDNQLHLCSWSHGCQRAKCHGWAHVSSKILIVLMASAGALLIGTCGLCVCACRKRRRCNRGKICSKKASVRSSCQKKSATKKLVKKESSVEYAPFQMPFQLVPGGFAPVNPYSNIQGYPMVNLSAPVEESEQV